MSEQISYIQTGTRRGLLLPVVVATQKLVAFDRGDDANGALVARFGPLDAAKQRTRTGPASVISFGKVKRISIAEPCLTSLERKK